MASCLSRSCWVSYFCPACRASTFCAAPRCQSPSASVSDCHVRRSACCWSGAHWSRGDHSGRPQSWETCWSRGGWAVGSQDLSRAWGKRCGHRQRTGAGCRGRRYCCGRSPRWNGRSCPGSAQTFPWSIKKRESYLGAIVQNKLTQGTI